MGNLMAHSVVPPRWDIRWYHLDGTFDGHIRWDNRWCHLDGTFDGTFESVRLLPAFFFLKVTRRSGRRRLESMPHRAIHRIFHRIFHGIFHRIFHPKFHRMPYRMFHRMFHRTSNRMFHRVLHRAALAHRVAADKPGARIVIFF